MTNKNVNAQNGLNSIWTDSIANNQHPDNKALLAHLKTVHQNNAGFTEKCEVHAAIRLDAIVMNG